ncbi:ATP-binding cassette domain-containing protein [Halomonas sp. H10-9-1]|uniref:ATP-binding cassette domain-containing protein n=1 Tax=Halomonas sp. H10-9-1 TaxID=2950871 RepID=UPI0032DEB73D
MEDAKEIALEACGLTRRYRMGEVTIQALRGVDLALYHGELLVLLGASGSGKSTLLNILGGLDSASEGKVRHRDRHGRVRDLTRASQRELTRYPCSTASTWWPGACPRRAATTRRWSPTPSPRPMAWHRGTAWRRSSMDAGYPYGLRASP